MSFTASPPPSDDAPDANREREHGHSERKNQTPDIPSVFPEFLVVLDKPASPGHDERAEQERVKEITHRRLPMQANA